VLQRDQRKMADDAIRARVKERVAEGLKPLHARQAARRLALDQREQRMLLTQASERFALSAAQLAERKNAFIDALKVGKSYARAHVLYAISSLVAHASGQGDKVPAPSATLILAQQNALDVLPLAVNCVNKAMEQADTQAKLSNKVFSPQNWCKTTGSVQGEALVATTIIGMMPGLGAGDLNAKLKVSPDRFGLRWSAE
jgi:hypothetical protein